MICSSCRSYFLKIFKVNTTFDIQITEILKPFLSYYVEHYTLPKKSLDEKRCTFCT